MLLDHSLTCRARDVFLASYNDSRVIFSLTLPTACVQDDWVVCRVFNKDLAVAKNAPQMAPAVDGATDDPLAFLDVDGFINYDELLNNPVLLDNFDLPMLMDSPFGADDFAARASSSTSSAALALEPDMEHRTINAEPPMPQ
ncbi:hypothetical protein ZWY2020_028132 [Hordeum vulgare]|nr:hypothetical protein ZWY2020_028132 [Hordeum vulgare]